MAHAAVEIRALAALQPESSIVLGVNFDRAAQHIDELFAAMLTPVIELLDGARAHPYFQRDHGLMRQFRGMRPIVVLPAAEIVAFTLACRGLATRDEVLGS